jgi:hypothetical protein
MLTSLPALSILDKAGCAGNVRQNFASLETIQNLQLFRLHPHRGLSNFPRLGWLEHQNSALVAENRVARHDDLASDADGYVEVSAKPEHFGRDWGRTSTPDRKTDPTDLRKVRCYAVDDCRSRPGKLHGMADHSPPACVTNIAAAVDEHDVPRPDKPRHMIEQRGIYMGDPDGYSGSGHSPFRQDRSNGRIDKSRVQNVTGCGCFHMLQEAYNLGRNLGRQGIERKHNVIPMLNSHLSAANGSSTATSRLIVETDNVGQDRSYKINGIINC